MVKTMPRKDDVAADLIRAHFALEPFLTEVWRIVGDSESVPDEPIKLLEVNAATVVTGSVIPFAFTPTQDVPYSTIIAEVTPSQFDLLQREPWRLPEGWRFERAQRFERSMFEEESSHGS
jgi:hypothetical protein